MPYFVYILRSERTGRFYIGCTADLDRRISEHARGQTASTRGRGPWVLVYQERFSDLSAARRREAEIKGWKSRRAIEELIG
jgi:putative endonuclease